MKFLSLFKRKIKPQLATEGTDFKGMPCVDTTVISHSGIHKTKHKQFSMDMTRLGGRVVKTMPRNLRHMKELSEKTDD